MSFQEDAKAKRELDGVVGKRILGVECPKMNKTGEVCKECDRVRKLYRQNTADAEKEAQQRKAQDTYFLNVQLRNGEFTALKIGKKVAKSLKKKLENYKDRTGKAFGFANLDEGEWLAISKDGEYPNFEYELDVLGEKADSVSADTVKELPSLNNLTEDYENGVLDLMDVSSLSSGDSLEFRMVPIPTEENKATEMIYRYYHWRCSPADILGGEDVDSVVDTGDAPPKEFSEYMTADTPEDTGTEPDTNVVEKYTMDNKPECWGYFDNESDCFDPDCEDIVEACAKKAGYMKNDEGDFVKAKKKKK